MARTMEVPFVTLPDGRKCLTSTQLLSDPELMKFYERFKGNFTTDINMDVVIFRDRKADIWSAVVEASR